MRFESNPGGRWRCWLLFVLVLVVAAAERTKAGNPTWKARPTNQGIQRIPRESIQRQEQQPSEQEYRFLQNNDDELATETNTTTISSTTNEYSSGETLPPPSRCSLCPRGSILQVEDAARVIIGGDINTTVTCGDVDQTLRENDNDDCSNDALLENGTFLPVNLPAFCGCLDTFASNDCGPLCPSGTAVNDETQDLEFVVEYSPEYSPSTRETTTTCAELDYLVPFIVNDNGACQALTPFRTQCCMGIQEPVCDVCPGGIGSSGAPPTPVAVARAANTNGTTTDIDLSQSPYSSWTVDGVPCEEWVLEASYDADARCDWNRLLGSVFCGCSAPNTTTTSADTCTLCPAASDSFIAAKPFPDSDLTCGDLANVAALDGDDTCNLVQSFATYCECDTAEPLCSMCPDGVTAENLTKPITFYDSTTCADIVTDLSLVLYDESCEAPTSEYLIDIPYYCGCPNTKPSNVCSFCRGDAPLTDPDLPIPELNGTTCGELEAYTMAVTNDTLCPKLQAFSGFCCAARCSLCPQLMNSDAGGDDDNFTSLTTHLPKTFTTEKMIPGLGLTCGNIESTLVYVTAEKCDDAKEGFDIFDIGVYCGCNPVDPDDYCSLCPPRTIVNAKNSLPDGQSCQEAADVALATPKNSSACGDFRLLGSEYCCGAGASSQQGDETTADSGQGGSFTPPSSSSQSGTASHGIVLDGKHVLLVAISCWILSMLL